MKMDSNNKHIRNGLFILFVISILYYGNYQTKSAIEYEAVQKYISNSIEIRNSIGIVSKIELIQGIKLYDHGESGDSAGYEFDLYGNKTKANLSAWVSRSKSCKGLVVKSKLKIKTDETELEEVCQL